MADELINNEPTPQEQTKNSLGSSLSNGYGTLLGSFNHGQCCVWQNPFGLTPQEVFDLYGKKAAKLLAVSVATINYLNYARAFLRNPGEVIKSLKPAGTTLTVNPDGTVTVGAG